MNIGPVTVNNSTTKLGFPQCSSTGDTPQYATSSNGLNYLSKAGLLNKCNETSSACQAKTIQEKSSCCSSYCCWWIILDAPNAYSDDDQSIFQKATNALPYYGIQVCFGSPFQFQPSEQVLRDEFACLLVKAIKAGTTDKFSGSIDKYSDEGASKWTNEINILAANDVIPPCSDISDKFCPSRKITIGEVSFIMVNQTC